MSCKVRVIETARWRRRDRRRITGTRGRCSSPLRSCLGLGPDPQQLHREGKVFSEVTMWEKSHLSSHLTSRTESNFRRITDLHVPASRRKYRIPLCPRTGKSSQNTRSSDHKKLESHTLSQLKPVHKKCVKK